MGFLALAFKCATHEHGGHYRRMSQAWRAAAAYGSRGECQQHLMGAFQLVVSSCDGDRPEGVDVDSGQLVTLMPDRLIAEEREKGGWTPANMSHFRRDTLRLHADR